MIIFLGIPAGIAAGVAAYIMGGSFPIILAAYTLGVVAAALPFYLYLGLRNTAQARVPRSPRRRETRQRRLGSVFVARTVLTRTSSRPRHQPMSFELHGNILQRQHRD